MKIKNLKPLVTASACLLGLFILQPVQARDHIGFSIQIGGPPPPRPVIVERRWEGPSPDAVWVEPHYEWLGGRWFWVRGYYMYPPHPHAEWIPGHYVFRHHSHFWVGGHWSD